MFKAIGFLIILWGLSHFFSLTFSAFDKTASESLKTLEMFAVSVRDNLPENI
ncbi:MAG: hypothetical protein R3B60_03510 [Candidatus Paceibacterota bacterium]